MKTTLALLLLALLPAGMVSAADKVKPYPLKTCIVTDNALDSMGGEKRIVHNGQEIKFCCKPCIAKFKKNPEKYLKKLR
jgi:YHS domain-containing protein